MQESYIEDEYRHALGHVIQVLVVGPPRKIAWRSLLKRELSISSLRHNDFGYQ
jgi:hypothetical protein